MTARVWARDADVEPQAVRGGDAPGIRNPNEVRCETVVVGRPPAWPWRRRLAMLAVATLLSAAPGASARNGSGAGAAHTVAWARSSGRWRLLAAALLVALGAALTPAAQARTRILVSNTGQADGGTARSVGTHTSARWRRARAFSESVSAGLAFELGMHGRRSEPRGFEQRPDHSLSASAGWRLMSRESEALETRVQGNVQQVGCL